MITTLTIEGREVGFKASGLTPTLYQTLTGTDIFDDFPALQESIAEKGRVDGKARIIIEKMAYTMAKQYDNSIGTMEEWLDSFENTMFAGEIAIAIVDIWLGNSKPSVESKKNKRDS